MSAHSRLDAEIRGLDRIDSAKPSLIERTVTPWYGRNDVFIAEALSRPGWFEARVLPKISRQANDCWTWIASLSSYGHGRIKAGPTQVYAHRVVWIALRGSIPEGLLLDHDGPNGCHNRACVNPDHLTIATNRENTVVTASAGVAHEAALRKTCPMGHPLIEGNLVASASRRGRRGCLSCNRSRSRDRTLAVREAAVTLGLTYTDYVKAYGNSVHTARHLLGGSMPLVALAEAS